MIIKSFSVRDKDANLQLYKSLVKPHLEYSIHAWRPHFPKDIDLIEGVQRRATKLISDLKDKSYEDRFIFKLFESNYSRHKETQRCMIS